MKIRDPRGRRTLERALRLFIVLEGRINAADRMLQMSNRQGRATVASVHKRKQLNRKSQRDGKWLIAIKDRYSNSKNRKTGTPLWEDSLRFHRDFPLTSNVSKYGYFYEELEPKELVWLEKLRTPSQAFISKMKKYGITKDRIMWAIIRSNRRTKSPDIIDEIKESMKSINRKTPGSYRIPSGQDPEIYSFLARELRNQILENLGITSDERGMTLGQAYDAERYKQRETGLIFIQDVLKTIGGGMIAKQQIENYLREPPTSSLLRLLIEYS